MHSLHIAAAPVLMTAALYLATLLWYIKYYYPCSSFDDNEQQTHVHILQYKPFDHSPSHTHMATFTDMSQSLI